MVLKSRSAGRALIFLAIFLGMLVSSAQITDTIVIFGAPKSLASAIAVASFEPAAPFAEKIPEEKRRLALPAKTASKNTTPIPPAPASMKGDYPVRIVVPSIGLDSAIEGVGVNKEGEMDVPDGNTDIVGWYKKGTVPGNVGSAVLDAHVYAAFSELHRVSPGEHIYIYTAKNKKLDFVVSKANTYALNELSPSLLFSQNDARRLNLITCAGSLTADGSTYDHRLVVFAILNSK